jgi:hypothetical protein
MHRFSDIDPSIKRGSPPISELPTNLTFSVAINKLSLSTKKMPTPDLMKNRFYRSDSILKAIMHSSQNIRYKVKDSLYCTVAE